MNKADYIVLVGIIFFSFYFVWRKKKTKKEIDFNKEVSELKNAVEIAALVKLVNKQGIYDRQLEMCATFVNMNI